MKKHKIIFAVLITFVLVMVALFTVVASTDILDFSSNTVEEQLESVNKKFEKNFKNNENYIKSFCNKFYKHQTLSYYEYNQLVNYITFLMENDFSIQEMKYFEKLISNGTSLNGLMSVYNFWTTTSEDFEMIGSLCEYEYKYTGDHWVENAFNYITSDKTGVLTGDDIKIYYDKGLTYDDIYTANILCRKGNYTIEELLEKRLNGIEWNELFEELEDVEVSNNYKNGQKILRAVKAKKKYKKLDLNKYDETEIHEKITEIENEYYTLTDEQVGEMLTSFKVYREDISADSKLKRDEEYRNKIIENGMPVSELDSLEYRGYSLEDIYAVSTSDDYLLSLKQIMLERRK